MQSLQNLSKVELRTLLMCVYDVSNFIKLAKSFPPKEPDKLFSFMNGFSGLTSQKVADAGGLVIKYLGDGALIVFDDQDVDASVMAMHCLKADLEAYLAQHGFRNAVAFSLHIGEAAIGYIGTEPFRWIDIMGNPVQVVFTMLNPKQRFAITPQVFRKLKPETRKLFHKFTPPILYLAEE